MNIDEFKYNYIHNNGNGVYSKEKYVKENFIDLYKEIIEYVNLDISFKEKVYLYVNGIEKKKCSNCGKYTKFINKYQPEEVYSFSSIEWPGLVYEKIGMVLKSISKESYWFINSKNRISRHTYNKQNLIKMGYDKNLSSSEIIKQLKLIKIYGPGNKRYVWNKSL